MKIIASVLCAFLLLPLAVGSACADGDKSSAKDKKEQTQKKDKDKDKKEDPNKGGAGVGVPTVHGCDHEGCWNNGPGTPKEPEKKCHKEKGIEICN